MVNVVQTDLPGVLIVEPRVFGDDRGFFFESFNAEAFAAAGLPTEFVQDNHSMSAMPGTVRGLHYQLAPNAQDKLIRVLAGSILDVAVDIRRGSPTFGQFVSATLSAENFAMLFVPIGFAHGFVTLEPNTQVAYKVTNYYAPTHERGLRWNDPAIGIPWGIAEAEATLSGKDKIAPLLADAELL